MAIVYSSSSLKGMEVLSCSGDHSFSKHLHDGYVLWLNSESAEKFSIKGSSGILTPGAIGIIEPEVVHTNSPCLPERRHLRSFYFTEEFCRVLLEDIFAGEGKPLSLQTTVLEDMLLWIKFIDLHNILFQEEDDLTVESAILSTFAHLAESCAGSTLNTSLSPAVSGREPRVKTVIEFFHDNIGRQFSLDELAAVVHCSKYHLIRLFRLQHGISPHAYLVLLRLEYARKMLESGQGIAEAAMASGFSDQSHLTRKFKSRYGLSPGLYQAQRTLKTTFK